MAKTLREILPEVYEPKPEDEKNFKAKHGFDPKTGRWPMFPNMYSAEKYDTLFRGSTKKIDREKDRHGYNSPDDEAHYEEYNKDAVQQAAQKAIHALLKGRTPSKKKGGK